MAAPSFIDAGTGAPDAGSDWSYTCQAAGAAGRVFIVQILQDGISGTHAVTGSSNINDLAGAAGWTAVVINRSVGIAALQHIYIGRSTSTSAPTISGTNNSSEDLFIRSYQFTDVSIGTTLATVIENIGGTSDLYRVVAGTSATAEDAAVTNAGPDRLALNFVGVNDDNAISTFNNGYWSEPVAEYADSGGTDGAIGLQVALFQDANDYLAGTASNSFGHVSVRERAAQQFLTNRACHLTKVTLRLFTGLSPTDSCKIAIQADNGGNPSETDLASQTIAASSLTDTEASYDFTFSLDLSASSTYWIVLSRTGSLTDDNGYYTGQYTSSVYGGGVGSFYTTANGWVGLAGGADLEFATFATLTTIDGGTASIVDSDAWGVIGFALIGTTAATKSLPLPNRNMVAIRR